MKMRWSVERVALSLAEQTAGFKGPGPSGPLRFIITCESAPALADAKPADVL
jgi:hypothetical protein